MWGRCGGANWLGGVLLAGLLLAPARAAEQPGPVGEPDGLWRAQIHFVPAEDARGRTVLLYTRICRPLGDQPARVVLINHGKPADDRVGTVQPQSCSNEAVQWFLTRGYLVVAGVRRGYGRSSGDLAEATGGCSANELVNGAREGARDVEALRHYTLSLPYASQLPVVVIGQSVGGWVSDGLNSLPHSGVGALVSMAGGNGGHIHGVANLNCRPDQLVLAAGILGRTATTPMLWIYTANDSYFAPALAKQMYDAFTAAGGRAEFLQLPPFGADGHQLFFSNGGSAIWGPPMESYLARMLTR
jgi:pimeloyl-ACP methyl ester carboxylesterase